MKEQRRDTRYGARLAVRYTNAERFVTDYVENLSKGGLFIAGAELAMGAVTDVHIDIPDQGSWTVRAKVVYLLDAPTAGARGRRPGAGLSIIERPAGFDDALLGYLLRLGRRREHAVMIAEDAVGRSLVEDAGYRVLPLESRDEIAFALADETAKVIAIIATPGLAQSYRDRLDDHKKPIVFDASTPEEIRDILARIDSLL